MPVGHRQDPPMQTSGKPKALREISFIELLVSNDGGVMVFKGVPGQPSLSPVPAELQDEAQSMFKAGMAAARSRPMFRILHDKEIGRSSCRERVCQYV